MEYSFTLKKTDLLEISIEVSTSSIDIDMIINGESLHTWTGMSSELLSKLAVKEDGSYKLRIENPGTFSGGDELEVHGYYIITPDAADQAQIILSSTKVPWIITFIDIFLLSACLYIL